MDKNTHQQTRSLPGLPPVYVVVPDKSGILDSGCTKLLNTSLTEAEALVVAEPAPVLDATKAEKRRRDLLGVTWILACLTSGALIKIYVDAANDGHSGDAGWVLPVLALLVPLTVAFTYYPHWKHRQHQKRHRAWLARFVESWPLRERLIDVETIPDVWQRVSTRTMADTLARDRDTVLTRGTAAGENAGAVLAGALAAVGTWACAPSPDPALYRVAEQAVDRFGGLAGRRRADVPPAPPSNLP